MISIIWNDLNFVKIKLSEFKWEMNGLVFLSVLIYEF